MARENYTCLELKPVLINLQVIVCHFFKSSSTELAGLQLPGPLPSPCSAQLSVWPCLFCFSLFLCYSEYAEELFTMWGFFPFTVESTCICVVSELQA